MNQRSEKLTLGIVLLLIIFICIMGIRSCSLHEPVATAPEASSTTQSNSTANEEIGIALEECQSSSISENQPNISNAPAPPDMPENQVAWLSISGTDIDHPEHRDTVATAYTDRALDYENLIHTHRRNRTVTFSRC